METAFNGLKFSFRDKLEGQPYSDLFQLARKAISHENLLKKSKRPSKHDVTFVERYKSEDDLDQGEYAKIVVAKMVIDKPYVSQALRRARIKEKLKENIVV